MIQTEVIVYTMNYCPFCDAAKRLLKSKGIEYSEKKLADNDEAEWDRLETLTGLKTMPQIFIGEVCIGGYHDLQALDQSEGLRKRVGLE